MAELELPKVVLRGPADGDAIILPMGGLQAYITRQPSSADHCEPDRTERGGRWDDIAEALNLTAEQASDHYAIALAQWEDALNRPWERSGRFLSSRMPDGTTEPDEAAADLDQWCLQHLAENHGARHNARHACIEDRMVSANLPEHTPLTEMNSLTRTAAYLIRRGGDVTEAERDSYEARKKTLMAKLD